MRRRARGGGRDARRRTRARGVGVVLVVLVVILIVMVDASRKRLGTTARASARAGVGKTRARFETCAWCERCAMEAELEASDVVDTNGWCARCDCDARVERVDAGRPGRYVGKSSAMVLRGVTTTGREVSVKAWCGIRGEFRQHANAPPVEETCPSETDASIGSVDRSRRVLAIHGLIEKMGFGRYLAHTELKTLRFFTPRDEYSFGGKQVARVLVTNWARGVGATDINGAREGENKMTRELFRLVSRLKREDIVAMTLLDFLLGNYDRNIFNMFFDEDDVSVTLIDNEDMFRRYETNSVTIPGTNHHWHFVEGYVIKEKEKNVPSEEKCRAKSANETKPACIVELQNGNWPLTIGAILDYRCWVKGGAVHREYPSQFRSFVRDVIESSTEELVEKHGLVEDDVIFLKERANLLDRYGFEGALKIVLLQSHRQHDIRAPCCDPLRCPWPADESLDADEEINARRTEIARTGPYVRNHNELSRIAQSFIGPNDARSVSAFLKIIDRDNEADDDRSGKVVDGLGEMRGPTVESVEHHDTPLLVSSSDNSFEWRQIERVSASALTSDAFVREYVQKGVPVVIEHADLAAALRGAVTREVILDLCGDSDPDLGSKIVRPIRAMAKSMRSTHPRLLQDLSERLKSTRGLSLDDTLNVLEGEGEIKTLRDFFNSEFMGNASARTHKVDFLHPADNLWPPSVHSWHIPERCPALAEHVRKTVEQRLRGDWSYVSEILHGENPTEFQKFMLFASGDGVRAYHAHHHNKAAHVMVLVLQGVKRAVVWDRADDDNLYPLEARTGRMYNPIYMANAFNVDLNKQPKIAQSHGFGAVVKAGDILFMPCGWIHSFENVGETIQLVWSPTIKYHKGEQSIVPILEDGEAKYCPNENGREGYRRNYKASAE